MHRTLILYGPILLGLQNRNTFFHMVGNRDVGEIIIYGRNEILCVCVLEDLESHQKDLINSFFNQIQNVNRAIR